MKKLKGLLHADPGEKLTRADVLSLAAAGCAVFSGVIHLGLARQHYLASPPAGVLFALAGLWQLFAAYREYPLQARWWNLSNIAFNVGLIGVYALSRMVPVLHDTPEPVEWFGLATKASELLLIVCLIGLLRLRPQIPGGEASSPGSAEGRPS